MVGNPIHVVSVFIRIVVFLEQATQLSHTTPSDHTTQLEEEDILRTLSTHFA